VNDYGSYGPLPDGLGGPAGRRRRFRPLGCLTLLAGLAVLAAAAYALLSPFALHIGGRPAILDRTWHGVGAITATNGGRYVVYVSFRADVEHSGSSSDPYHCSQPGCDTIHGDGKLCTLSGTYPLEVEGEVYAWWSTDGALTHVRLSVPNSKGSTIVALFEGRWRGPHSCPRPTPPNSPWPSPGKGPSGRPGRPPTTASPGPRCATAARTTSPTPATPWPAVSPIARPRAGAPSRLRQRGSRACHIAG
jgi:hypothetical protein